MTRDKVTQVKVVGRVTLLLAGLALMMLLLNGCGGPFHASQGESNEGRRTSFVQLELSPTNNSGVSGSAAFAKAATGTKIEIELRGLPEPDEIYLAHVHQGTCEDEEHPDAPEGETAYHHSHEYGHEGHLDAHEQRENVEATAEEIEYPLTPVESNAAGEGSSTTVLDDVSPGELLSHGRRYLNVHAADSGDQPQLTCANLREANLRMTSENTTTRVRSLQQQGLHVGLLGQAGAKVVFPGLGVFELTHPRSPLLKTLGF